MLILFLAPDERLVGINLAVEGTIERFGSDGVAKPLGHEPRGLLGHTEILSELGAGDALLVRRDKPDSEHPRTKWDLAILEDRPDLDREAPATPPALVGLLVREVINPVESTVWAERAMFPADRGEVIDGGLFVRECGHHLNESIELFFHRIHTSWIVDEV